MNKILLKIFSNIKLIGLAVLIFFASLAITAFQLYQASNNSLRISLSSDSMVSNTFVTNAQPSKEVVIESSLLAQKLDLQRKIISPSSNASYDQIEKLVDQAGGEVIKTSSTSMVVNIPKDQETEILSQLDESNLVDQVEVDFPVAIASTGIDWGIVKIEVPPVWDTTKASGVKVAIIDTGIDYNHPNLRGRYLGGYNFVDLNNDPYDDHGHGTHVAGIVAAEVYDSEFQGAAPEAMLYAIKVLAADGSGYISDLVDGVDWAMNQGVQVMNFSLGTTYNSEVLEAKLADAQSRGIVLVGAAGNTNGGSLLYPAAYSSVIAVSATDSNDNWASFSSVGAELAAPGVAITSTVPGGGYATWSGTSMAAPHITASVALMLANNQLNVRSRLHETALDLGNPGLDSLFGYGRVVAKPAVLGDDTQAPIVSFLEPKHLSEVEPKVKISIDAQDEYLVELVEFYVDDQLIYSWTDEPYELWWDASNYLDQEVTFVAKAVDDSENVGLSKVSVKVVKELTISPSPVLKRKEIPNASRSGEIIHDLPSPAIERHRESENVPVDVPNYSPKHEIPPVTNVNQRNTQPSSLNTNSQKIENEIEKKPEIEKETSSAAKSNRPRVKGVKIEEKSFWQFVWEMIFGKRS